MLLVSTEMKERKKEWCWSSVEKNQRGFLSFSFPNRFWRKPKIPKFRSRKKSVAAVKVGNVLLRVFGRSGNLTSFQSKPVFIFSGTSRGAEAQPVDHPSKSLVTWVRITLRHKVVGKKNPSSAIHCNKLLRRNKSSVREWVAEKSL